MMAGLVGTKATKKGAYQGKEYTYTEFISQVRVTRPFPSRSASRSG
jgi:hypothetical protein